MFEFNANLTDEQKPVSIPTSWSEMSFAQYRSLVNEDDGTWLKRLSIMSGLDVDVINQMPTDLVSVLFSTLFFIKDQKEINDANVVDKKYNDFKFSRIELGWYSEINNELKKWRDYFGWNDKLTDDQQKAILGKVQINAAPKIIEVCTRKRIDDKTFLPGIKIEDDPVLSVMGLANFFFLNATNSLSNTST